MRRPAVALAVVAARVAPARLVRRLFRAWAVGFASVGDPRRAARQLLELDADLAFALDRAAIRLDGGVHAKHRLTAYHEFFVERTRPGDRVLDLGCGNGELAADLATLAGARVTGVDWSSAAVHAARERYAAPGLEFVEADVRSYVPPEPADIVVLSNVLEHIDDRVGLLRSIVERTRPRMLLIRVPVLARDWRVPLREELGLFHFSDPTHVVEYDPDLFTGEMAEAGLVTDSMRLVWGEIWAEVRPQP